MNRTIRLARRATITSRRDEWADYATVRVPFTGAYDRECVLKALRGSPKVVGVGSYRGAIMSVNDNGDSTLDYTVRWCIGD